MEYNYRQSIFMKKLSLLEQFLNALCSGARRGEPLPLLLPAEQASAGHPEHVQQAGHAVQQLPGILRRLSEVQRGMFNVRFIVISRKFY